jgi:hypothetical protein
MKENNEENMSSDEYQELIQYLYDEKFQEIIKKTETMKLCFDCQNRFYNYGYMCSEVIDMIYKSHLCSINTMYHDFLEDKGFLSTIKFLERKGYLISTECEGGFCYVKLNDAKFIYNQDTQVICWCCSVKKQGRPKKQK